MHTDLSVSMDDRPGAIADLCVELQRAGVTVGAICADGTEIDHFLVDDAETAKRVIVRAGYEVKAQRDVLLVDLEDRPDALGEVTRTVADAGVNLDLVYLASGNRIVLGGQGLDGPTKRMLSELTPARGASEEGWTSLTKSEVKVVRLVARGMSNGRIAEELYVSPRTVRSHLEHVFKKLGVRSRVELAVKAAQRNIGRSDDEDGGKPR